MPYLGRSPTQAVRARYYYTASAGDTSVSGSDDNSNTLIFSDGEFVDVSLNGVTLVAGTDYVTSTANTIGSLSAMSANDVVEVVVYDVFSVFDGNVNSDFSIGGDATVAGTTSLTGKVGIGIATASEMLEIFNATSPAIQLNDGGDYQAQIALATNDLEIRGSSGNIELYVGNADGASSTKQFVMAANGEVTFSAEDPANAAFNSFNANALTVNRYGGTTNGSAFTASSSNATAAIAAENAKGQIGTVTNHPLEIHTNKTVRMLISSEGYITQNNLPFVFVNGNDLNTRTLANGDVFFNTNQGSQAAASVTGSSTVTGAGNSGITYTSSNGRFTVPVAGKYFISGRFRYGETGDEAVSVIINTNGNQDIAVKILQCTEATTLIITACAVLAANDFIHFKNGSGADRGFFMANGHCGASIFLIG